MAKKSTKSKKSEKQDLGRISEEITKSMKENLAYNLEHPEEYDQHEDEVERALDEVMKRKSNKAK
jgi:hypothetical protein